MNNNYENTNYDKTIYLIWRNKTDEKTNAGFGDKIRGSLFVYQYCKQNNFNFKIDATDDICNDFLKNVISDDYNIIKDKPLIIIYNDAHDNVNTFVSNVKNNKNSFIFTNMYPLNDLSADDKKFAKFLCEPKYEFQAEINNKINKLPQNYGIKHFRFIDEVFQNDVNINDDIFKKCFELLQNNYLPTDILISNSNNFKKYAKDNLNIKTIDCDNGLCKVEHIGKSTNYEYIKNSFIELFIINNAKYIKSYSCYNWPSNFVYWPSKIYDIPFESVYVY